MVQNVPKWSKLVKMVKKQPKVKAFKTFQKHLKAFTIVHKSPSESKSVK